MLPILLVYKDQNKIKKYVKNVQEMENIKDENVFRIEPEKKQFSINQIKEIKKSIIYNIVEPRLYLLINFDKSSFEAQNAFLKTLEEHSTNVFFVLTATQYYNLAPTLISRSKILFDTQATVKSNEQIELKIDELINNNNLGILGDKLFQAKGKKNPVELLDNILIYFRNRLEKDHKATDVLREILNYRSYILYNSVDAQNAIDHVLIYIYKAYQ